MSLRRSIRTALDHGARGLGLLHLFERRMRRELTVLMYHRVLPATECVDYPFPSLVMPADWFEAQVSWLAAESELVTVSAGLAALASPARVRPRPLVALTFDDGYWDNHAIAAPILERHGARGTFFVTTDFVASGLPMWFDRAAAIIRATPDRILNAAASAHGCAPPAPETAAKGRVRAWVEALKGCAAAQRETFLGALGPAPDGTALFDPMSPVQVGELARRGHEIGAHSCSHAILPLADADELARELRESRAALRAWTGTDVAGFCYPNGSHDERVVAATRRAGYGFACTTEVPAGGGVVDPLRLARHDVTPDRVSKPGGAFDLTAFRAEVAGWHTWLR
ncbi:MAG: polysaccharide deacetylase family protein [Planctomycetes bacterium]|nr:polysaccharide deacetylase family protein [Planctomycetota bacterium]